MSFILRSTTGLTILPNPVLGNSRGIAHSVNYRLSITGVVYTYKRKHDDTRKRRFEYQFEGIGHEKMVEVQEFFKLFGGEQIQITTHANETYSVYFADDDIQFTTDGRANPLGSDTGRREAGSFTLNFVEV